MRRFMIDRRFRPTLEALENRSVPSTTVTAAYRPLEFDFEASFSGNNTFPPVNDEDPGAMSDWSGALAGSGKVTYTSPTAGTGTFSGTGVDAQGTGSNMFGDITYTFKLSASGSFTFTSETIRVSRTGFGMTITEREGSGPTDGTPLPPSPSTEAAFDPLAGLNVDWYFPIGDLGSRSGNFMMENFAQSTTAKTDLAASSVTIKNGIMTGVVTITGQLMTDAATPESASFVQAFWATGASRNDIIGEAMEDPVDVAWNHGKLTIVTTDLIARPMNATHLLFVADSGDLIIEDNEVNNVAAFAITPEMAPKATLSNTGPVGERGQVQVKFTGQSSPLGVDSNVYRYAYDWNNDGVWDVGEGTAGGLAGAVQTVPFEFVDAGPGTRTIKGRIFGKFGGYRDYTTTIEIRNAPPKATFAGPVREGQASSVAFTNLSDSAADAAAGFRFAYDFNNDGKWELGDGSYAGGSTSASANVPAQFNLDGSAKKFIKGRIIDQDGGFTDYLVNVENVAPAATFANGGTINEGGSATVAFTNPTDPAPADTSAAFRYSYDLNNDGRWDVGNGAYAGGVTRASHTFVIPDNGPRTVKGRITDKDGGSTDYTTTIAVNSLAPAALFKNSVLGKVNENGVATVSFSGQTDPSSVDKAKGFRYSYDFDNDGIWELGNGAYAGGVTTASKAIPASFLADGARALTVKGRITDKDGHSNDYTTVINVLNVAPTAALKNDGPKGVGQNVTFTFYSIADVSPVDKLAGFTFSFDWNNDGTFDESGADAVRQHAFSTAGSHKVRGRIQDKDGGFRDYFTTVTIR